MVDDEVLIRSLLADELREAGFSVVEAANGDDALAFLQSGGPVDMVFTDVRMPGAIDGLELARRVRQDFPSLPVVVTSGNASPQEAGRYGVFIPKPYDFRRAVVIVADLLKGPAPGDRG